MNHDIARAIRIRPGGPADAPAVLDMLDGAVAWMNGRGNTQQWGTTPYSQKPGGAERVRRYTTEQTPYLAELGGTPVGAMVLGSGPSPQMPIAAAGEPERYVRLLVSDPCGMPVWASGRRCWPMPSRRPGGPAVELLRVDCWAGGGGELVAFYERNGFAPASRFMSGDWPGQVLTRRLG